MKKYLNQVKNSRLFEGIAAEDVEKLLNCLSAFVRYYEKGAVILHSADSVTALGLVLSGSVHIQREDFWGNRTIISEVSESGLFGESYACLPERPAPISAVAAQGSAIMFLDIHRIITTCSSACVFHSRLIQNLVMVLALKNVMLTEKIEHISHRSTREKLLSYLSGQARETASASFEIPFNRQQLADYLCVDRSAMSSALGQLRDEGVLGFERSRFKLF